MRAGIAAPECFRLELKVNVRGLGQKGWHVLIDRRPALKVGEHVAVNLAAEENPDEWALAVYHLRGGKRVFEKLNGGEWPTPREIAKVVAILPD